MTEFIRRPKEESPFYKHLVRNEFPSAERYGEKVDRFYRGGGGTVTRLSRGPAEGYEPNAFKGLPRSTVSGVVPSVSGGDGRSATPRTWLNGEDRIALTNT